MHDDSVLVAIDAALRAPAECTCGNSLEVIARDTSIWLECPTFQEPSWLPAQVAGFLRDLVHVRRLVIEAPATLAPMPAEGCLPVGSTP